jgi:hypothetical protein
MLIPKLLHKKQAINIKLQTIQVVQAKSEQWIVHSPHQTQLENPPTPKRRIGCSYTPWCNFPLDLHEIIFLKLAATSFGLN